MLETLTSSNPGFFFLSKNLKAEMLKKLKKNNIMHFFFLAYNICLSVLKLRGKLKRNRLRS